MVGKPGSDERGAIAVFLAIVVIFVLLPVAGASLSTFVREGTAGELQRSADSGALAGARLIPITDLPALPDLGPALSAACDQASVAASTDAAIGDQFTTTPECSAAYVPDPNVIGALQNCAVNAINNPDPGMPDEITSLPGYETLASTNTELVEQVEERIRFLSSTLASTVPAITKPGIRVTLTRGISDGGPEEIPVEDAIDGQADGAGADIESKTSVARRRIKNIALLPVVYDASTGTYTIDPNESLPSANEAIAALEALETDIQTDPILGSVYADLGCTNVIDRAAEDIRDLYNPGAGNPPTQEEVLSQAREEGAAVLGFVYDEAPETPDLPAPPEPLPSPSLPGLPGSPEPDPTPSEDPSADGLLETLLDTLRVPFLDFVPLCVQSTDPLAVDFANCQAANGAMRATLVPDE